MKKPTTNLTDYASTAHHRPRSAQLEEMAAIREGVTSFSSSCLPRLFMLDDATISRPCARQAKHRAHLQCTRENGGAIDVLSSKPSRRKTRPKYHALTRPTTPEAEATSRAIALAEMPGAPVYIVISPATTALEKVPKRETAASPFTPRPARNTYIFAGKIGRSWI